LMRLDRYLKARATSKGGLIAYRWGIGAQGATFPQSPFDKSLNAEARVNKRRCGRTSYASPYSAKRTTCLQKYVNWRCKLFLERVSGQPRKHRVFRHPKGTQIATKVSRLDPKWTSHRSLHPSCQLIVGAALRADTSQPESIVCAQGHSERPEAERILTLWKKSGRAPFKSGRIASHLLKPESEHLPGSGGARSTTIPCQRQAQGHRRRAE